MNLKSLADQTLVQNAKTIAREEREKMTQFLHHLKEIERRRLFSDYGYKSLFEMTVKYFSYSESEAYDRISAMRLLKELPEIVEQKINQGELTLTHLKIAQKHFRREKVEQAKTILAEHKISLLNQISNTSIREAQRITMSLSSNPETVKPDQVRVVGVDQVELKFTVNMKTEEKMKSLKGLLAHKYPNMTMAELLDLLCDLGLKALDPAKTVAQRKSCVTNSVMQVDMKLKDQGHAPPIAQADKANAQAHVRSKVLADVKSKAQVFTKSKAQIRREVYLRAQGKCEKCGSTHALEIDHIYPKALGGSDSAENLRLLCRHCNQRAAIQVMGIEKMVGYLG